MGELGCGGTPTEAGEPGGESRLADYRVDWLATVTLEELVGSGSAEDAYANTHRISCLPRVIYIHK